MMDIFEIYSSSESENSDLEILDRICNEENCLCNQCRPKIPRVQNFIENVINNYNDEHFQKNFRMRRSTFDYLLYLIRPEIEKMDERKRISPEKQLYIALWYLGTPDSYRSVTTKLGVSESTAWESVKRVVFAICSLRAYFIKWPTPQECAATAASIQANYLFPGVIGAVDGTHIKILAPKENHVAYINRKGSHSLQLQVTCNHKLEFIHCYTGLPGSVHDMRVFRYSGLQQRCTNEYFPDNYHLLGDSAYTLQKHVIVPYKDSGHLTVEHIYFNERLSSARMIVERAIGLLKAKWRFLLERVPMRRTDLIPYYIMACCVLHNLCLKPDDSFEYPIVIPEHRDIDEPLDVPNNLKVEGDMKREGIFNYLNEI